MDDLKIFDRNSFQTSETQTNDMSVITRLFKTTYMWMALALAITGLCAYFGSHNAAIMKFIFGNALVIIVLVVAELVLVGVLSFRIFKMSYGTATLLFMAYAILNGFTMSSIFLVYTKSSIASTFFISAAMFAVTSIMGFITQMDLSKIGNILLMALIGLIIASLVNIFLHSSRLDWICTIVGVLIFSGLTVYDTQRLKDVYSSPEYDVEQEGRKFALLGALSLYLDFINIFLYLLRIFGKRN